MGSPETFVILTGSEGFIGRHVKKYLLSTQQKFLGVDKILPKSIDGSCDLLDGTTLEEIFSRYRPTKVIHLAAQTNVLASVQDPFEDALNNIIGTINISKLSSEYKVKEFIYFNSGGAIYDLADSKKPTETSKTNPISAYGISKLAGELYAEQILKKKNINFLSIRLGNIYGSGQEKGVIPRFINNASYGLACDFFGDGTSSRNYLNVADLLSFLEIADRLQLSGVYNLASEATTTLKELLEIIASNFDNKIRVNYLNAIEEEIMHSDLCVEKALKIGWKPKINLEVGIRELITKQLIKI